MISPHLSSSFVCMEDGLNVPKLHAAGRDPSFGWAPGGQLPETATNLDLHTISDIGQPFQTQSVSSA